MKTSPATHTVQTLEAVISDITNAISKVKAQVALMKELALDSVTIESGQAEMERGLSGLNRFGSNLEKAIRAARIERGDFGVARGDAAKEPKRGRRPRKKS